MQQGAAGGETVQRCCWDTCCDTSRVHLPARVDRTVSFVRLLEVMKACHAAIHPCHHQHLIVYPHTAWSDMARPAAAAAFVP